MDYLDLIRVCNTSTSYGTYGVLKWADDDWPLCVTLEDPWLQNQLNVSCIPTGEYMCTPYTSRKHGDTFIVNDVRLRTYILFHRGNSTSDTEGCILVGTYVASNGKIANSTGAWNQLVDSWEHKDKFILRVSWAGTYPDHRH